MGENVEETIDHAKGITFDFTWTNVSGCDCSNLIWLDGIKYGIGRGCLS